MFTSRSIKEGGPLSPHNSVSCMSWFLCRLVGQFVQLAINNPPALRKDFTALSFRFHLEDQEG